MFSVIIPALNEEAYIEKTLASLQAQDYRGDFEIIVVDNGSIDQTAKIAAEHGAIVIPEGKKGVSRALVTGVAAARGDILVFTDADTIVPKHWLSRYAETFQSDARVIAAGGPYFFYGERPTSKIFVNRVIMPILYLVHQIFLHPFHPTLPCANMAVRRNAYERVGGFDADLTWGQEIELCKRLAKVGRILFLPRLKVMTSFRRYSGENNRGPKAVARSIREGAIGIGRGLTVVHSKRHHFSAQEEIRKKIND